MDQKSRMAVAALCVASQRSMETARRAEIEALENDLCMAHEKFVETNDECDLYIQQVNAMKKVLQQLGYVVIAKAPTEEDDGRIVIGRLRARFGVAV